MHSLSKCCRHHFQTKGLPGGHAKDNFLADRQLVVFKLDHTNCKKYTECCIQKTKFIRRKNPILDILSQAL